MIKKFGMKMMLVALILTALTTDSLAQQRVRFAKGRSAATLTGALAPDATREYVLGVSAGQTMTVQVTSGNNKIDLEITGRSGHLEWGDNGYAQVEINENGDHYVTIKNSGSRATKFSMTVTVR